MIPIISLLLLFISIDTTAAQDVSENINMENYLQTCTPESCHGVEYKSIAKKYYTGIFLTRQQIKSKEKKWRRTHAAKWRRRVPKRKRARWYGSDYDICCPTKLSHRNDTHLTNMSGQLKAIWHMTFLDPPRSQWIPHAECLGGGNCLGQCQVEKIMVNLLVVKLNDPWPFEFDSFEVDGYCSCKSIRS